MDTRRSPIGYATGQSDRPNIPMPRIDAHLGARVRRAVSDAAAEEERRAPFRLSGRGHEPRVTLDRALAAVLRSAKLPRVIIAGYGPNHHYPRRMLERAVTSLMNRLGWSPIGLGSQSAHLRTTGPVFFRGTLVDGPRVDLVALAGDHLSEAQEEELWGETSRRALLLACHCCEEVAVEEIDEAPSHSDTYFEYSADDRAELAAELRAVMERVLRGERL